MILNDRIKALRKSLGLTQKNFADSVSLKRQTIASYEIGKITPSDSTISLICKVFNVNPDWLKDGKGEMFIERTRDEQIAEFVGSIAETDSFKQRFVAMLSALDEKDWETLQKISLRLAEETK